MAEKKKATSKREPEVKEKKGKRKVEKKSTSSKKPEVKKATPKKTGTVKASKQRAKKVISKRLPKKSLALKKAIAESSEKAKKAAGKASKKVGTEKEAVTAKSGKMAHGEPTTMEELLAQTGYQLKGVKRGQLLEGTITDISKKMALVDIGSKTEGLVVDKEYEAAKEFISELSIGDKITVYVLSPENDRGQILLSLKKAANDRTWEKFDEALKTGGIVKVKGVDVNRGGVVVRADSLQGFVPSSQFGKSWLGRMEELLDQAFQVRVIEVDREKNRLIFSEKQVSEAEELKQRSQALQQIEVGGVYEGVVTGVMPFGVFVGVDVPLRNLKLKTQNEKEGRREKAEKSQGKQSIAFTGKVEGLVHISEISWEKVEDPNRYFKIGDKTKVKVLGIDSASGKLNLSIKRMNQDPWEIVEKKYPIGKKIRGKVARVAPFGVFVTLEPGIEGLLHISKIPAGEEPETGSQLDVFVEQVDMGNRRMSLGMVLKEVPVGYK